MINTERYNRANTAITHYVDHMEPRDTAVIDLLTDLRHYCKRHRVNFDKAVVMSGFHADAEGV